MSILYKNINYLDLENEKIIEGADIFIEGNLIKKIGNNLQIKASEVIDGNFLLMTPGFVNGHTHLGMSYFRNYADDLKLMDWLENEIWPIENKLTADDIYWSSLLSICENIKSGVTNFCDMYYEMDRVCDATIISGIRGTLTRGLTDNDGKGKEKLKSVRELYNNYHNKANGRIKVVPAPHAIYTCSENFLREISDLSKDLDGIINIHLSETKGEVENSLKEHGMTPISYVNSLGLLDNHVIAAHCVHITDEEISLIKDKKFYPIYNPTSNLKLASGFTPVEKLLKNNIIMGIGTDGDSSNNSQNLLQDMHIGAIVNKAREMDEQAVKAIEILKMATINGQRALGISKAGLIKEDYLADLTIFNLKSSNFTPKNNLINALVYSATAEDVRDVLCDGKFVMRNRELVNLDEERIKFEVNRHFEELVKR
ncbi:amidohydrolase [Peptoniphilus lacrimalis]|uniref:5-methylthioadenosine/S-adenosylhomocysteine deaminase n=1 Tax=Peptoniphilus lacrimalis TaxID=33031 RepID=A0A379C390_9FIRM|nr:amidohydrolase [Peptoniphilus lacrimalis]SUB56730.1 5-methylthioadenosine/S-adenosylhomocysteine deaminase [Peptoniphilus lacrimalis]